ncbi:MAG: EAL domain-containing protein, partial [Janthinobacterium lividum]
VSVAEEIGLIGDLGRWVLRQACLQLRDWQRSYPAQALRLSVNVSGIELMDALFTQRLQHTLETTGIAPGSLELEITESVLLTHSETLIVTLERIRAMGVRIALDDFGTGYSSLSYLKNYPLDTIKIDRSFISAIPEEERTMAIVETIVRLGHALKLEVVAEGVETAAQLDAATRLGCDYIQGYLMARPLPAPETQRLLDPVGPAAP